MWIMKMKLCGRVVYDDNIYYFDNDLPLKLKEMSSILSQLWSYI